MIGNTLGGYRIIEQIGRGGMATVYKAFDPSTERYVALKTLPKQYLQDETFRTRFEQEAKAIARLEHVHILPIFAYGEEDDITYIVMRYLDTGTLADYLQTYGMLPFKQCAQILEQIAAALTYAHDNNILHRDVKPSNILIDNQGNVLLADFGIAKMVDGSGPDLTGTGMIGTPKYMSPEQCLGKKNLTPASDQYALGIILYEMVTGQVPFDAETPLAVIQQHVSAPLPPPRTFRPDLPGNIQNVILRVLAREPEARYPTCNHLATAFNEAIASVADETAGTRTVIPQEAKTHSSRHRMLGGSIIVGLVLLLAVLLIFWPDILGGEDTTPTEASQQNNAGVTITQAVPTTGVASVPTQIEEITLTSTQGIPLSIADIAATDDANFTATADYSYTLTATVWTATPTRDVTQELATFRAEQTQQIYAGQTATATLWTPTSTDTFTPTDTSTPTFTLTLTDTPAETATLTSTDTSTPTRTYTWTQTFTRTPTLHPAEQALSGIASNDEWEPYSKVFDDVEMVLVPSGCFTMGGDGLAVFYDGVEWIQGVPDGGEICFAEPFWIDKTEVTNEQYGLVGCVDYSSGDEFPHNCANWVDAQTHCKQRDARLPTEAEWEYAARGPDSLGYPWGDTYIASTNTAIFYLNSGGKAAQVGSVPLGASWVGALDMAGNLGEWTSTIYKDYPYDAEDGREVIDNSPRYRVVRGGTFTTDDPVLRSASRARLSTNAGNYIDIGFRCVRNYKE